MAICSTFSSWCTVWLCQPSVSALASDSTCQQSPVYQALDSGIFQMLQSCTSASVKMTRQSCSANQHMQLMNFCLDQVPSEGVHVNSLLTVRKVDTSANSVEFVEADKTMSAGCVPVRVHCCSLASFPVSPQYCLLCCPRSDYPTLRHCSFLCEQGVLIFQTIWMLSS